MRFLRYVWPAPISCIGWVLALATRICGGRYRVHECVLECWGGFLPAVFSHPHAPMRIDAITLGHVVLAIDEYRVDCTREHERVHVRQFEKWGVLFPLLYFGESLIVWAQGKRAYRDNRFEREAYAAGPVRH